MATDESQFTRSVPCAVLVLKGNIAKRVSNTTLILTNKNSLLDKWNQIFYCNSLCPKAICQTPCKPGYNCTSPDVCTPDSSVGE